VPPQYVFGGRRPLLPNQIIDLAGSQAAAALAGTLVRASERIVTNLRKGSVAGSAEAHLACQEALGASW
jgi:hypothetical protein